MMEKNISEEEAKGALNEKEQQAEALLQDEEQTRETLNAADKLLDKIKKLPIIGRIADEIATSIELINDYIDGSYRQIPLRVIVAALAGILYLLSPIDLIPDFIPVVGWVDDVAVFTLILSMGLASELEAYRCWKEGRGGALEGECNQNCSESDEFEEQVPMTPLEEFEAQHKDTIAQHWESEVVFTDFWGNDTNQQQLTQEELLPGELSASILTVGCYTVRSAQRVYKVHKLGYCPELETPANESELAVIVESCKGENGAGMAFMGLFQPWRNEFRITREISAKHNADPNAAFTYICRAAEAVNLSWSEYIGAVCAAKENASIHDEQASLLVLNVYVGDSFRVPYWYKLDPNGIITKLTLHPFNSNQKNERFI